MASGHSALGRLQHALGRENMTQVCGALEKLMVDMSSQEWHTCFPRLVENIFGMGNEAGWGIPQVQGSHKEYKVLRRFLSVQGPMMKLVYSLLCDPLNFKYEFPVDYLPFPTKTLMSDRSTHNNVPVLYDHMIQLNQNGQVYHKISLNAFEYYYFHFAYCLVNPKYRNVSWKIEEALYPFLLEDYLNYFMPCDGKPVPSMPQVASPVRSPLNRQSNFNRSLMSSVGASPPQVMGSPLHFTNSSPGGLTSPLRLRSPPVPHHHSPSQQVNVEHETWRSQTFLQILIEFWLNQNIIDAEALLGGGRGQASFLPSTDHTRIVRMLIKHLHFFVNSTQSQYTAMEEFKRSLLPQYVQKKMYAFFRHGFDRWPLDASFKLILETWLSFIQPWRYVDATKNASNKETMESRVSEVGDAWQGFVVENLFFYTVLFQEVIHRMSKLDLTSPKNAHMLFRVCKVFGLPGLRDFIQDAELSLTDNNGASFSQTDLNRRPSQSLSHKNSMVNALQSQFVELESPHFQYVPMYDERAFRKVQDVMLEIQQAIASVREYQKRYGSASSGKSFSFLSLFGFGESESPGFTRDELSFYDEYTGDVGKRTEAHLEQALVNLCDVYGLRAEPWLELPDPVNQSKPIHGLSDRTDGLPDHVNSPHGPILTPRGRFQVINGLKSFDVVYRGDPDLQPIRSFEITFLVRMLHHFCAFFNARFEGEIHDAYTRRDLLGSLARVYLRPPAPATSGGSPPRQGTPQLEWQTRPRLSLRWLANKQNLFYLGLLYCITYLLFGFKFVGFCLVLLFMAALYGLFMALVQRTVEVRQDR